MMKTVSRALRELATGVGVLVVAIIVGQILYRLIGDLFTPVGMDRSQDAVTGAGVLFGVVVLIAHVIRRVVRRGKKLRPELG